MLKIFSRKRKMQEIIITLKIKKQQALRNAHIINYYFLNISIILLMLSFKNLPKIHMIINKPMLLTRDM